jgi:hypothetical protein
MIEESSKQLRRLLLETRGLPRRDFIKALGRTLAACGILYELPLEIGASAAEAPVTAFVFGGA